MKKLTPAQKRVLEYVQRYPTTGLGYTAKAIGTSVKVMQALERAGYVYLSFRSPLVDSQRDGWYWQLTNKAKEKVNA